METARSIGLMREGARAVPGLVESLEAAFSSGDPGLNQTAAEALLLINGPPPPRRYQAVLPPD
jgi:hypothetical protein